MTQSKNDKQEWTEIVIRTVMRAAIPFGDFHSRSAIQYAKEISEFLEVYGMEVRTIPGRDPNAIKLAIEYLDNNDPPERPVA
jgi:hypothetical protein